MSSSTRGLVNKVFNIKITFYKHQRNVNNFVTTLVDVDEEDDVVLEIGDDVDFQSFDGENMYDEPNTYHGRDGNGNNNNEDADDDWL